MGCTLNTEMPIVGMEMINPQLYVGAKVGLRIMCRDTFVSKYSGELMSKWRSAEIIDIKNSLIYVHFTNWSKNFDVWIDLNGGIEGISPMGMLSKNECDIGKVLTPAQLKEVAFFLQTGKYREEKSLLDIDSANQKFNFSVGDEIDVLDIFFRKGSEVPMKKWRKAKILFAKDTKIKVTFLGWSSKFDETLDVISDSERICEFGTKSNEQTSMAIVSSSPIKSSTNNKDNRDFHEALTVSLTASTMSSISLSEENGFNLENVDSKARQAFEAEINKEVIFMKVLADRGLHVIEIEGDGNCLFRAISHQLYLCEDYHEMLRAKCVEHMQKHMTRFQCFCVTDFDSHLKEMALPGTWGDDLEIRAMEEILDRIISIFSSNSSDPTVPIHKNFEEEMLLVNVPPIKLSYHGNSHYNSIFDNRQPLPLPTRNSSVILSTRLKLLCTERNKSFGGMGCDKPLLSINNSQSNIPKHKS